MKTTGILFLLLGLGSFAYAQHQHHGHEAGEHMAHRLNAAAKLTSQDDTAAHVITVRVGPLNLPARTTHADMPQAAAQFLAVPIDGWFTAYHPRLVDAGGNPLPNRLLHHVAFWNTGRADFLCPNKLEHVFGAGGEMNDWPALPGFGYRVHPGDRMRVDTMVHNPTDTSYPDAYLEVRIEYSPFGAQPQLRAVYPAWFDVQQCGQSGYDLKAGQNVTTGQFTLGYSGRLLGVGGHLHDYGESLELLNVTTGAQVAALRSQQDANGRILSMPIRVFADRGGFPLTRNDVLKVTATYVNPTGHVLPDGAMGIAVGYFLPDHDADFAVLQK